MANDQLFCKSHPNEFAKTVCVRHNSLLCVNCNLKKMKLADCDVKEIKFLDDRDKILLDCLHARQQISNRIQQHVEYEDKAQQQKVKFTKEVIEFREEVVKQLDVRKDESIKQINDMTTTTLTHSREQVLKLREFDRQITEIIQQLPDQSAADLREVASHVKQVKTSVSNENVELMPVIKGYCKPEKSIMESICRFEKIAEIAIFDNVIYESYDPKAQQLTAKTEAVHAKSSSNYMAEQDEIYEEVNFSGVTVHPKQFINKTLTMSELKGIFDSSYNFIKLVCLGKSRIALMSKSPSVVVIIRIDGKVLFNIELKDLTGIVGIDNDRVAVLVGQRQIVIYHVGDKELKSERSFDIETQPELKHVLGFDYHLGKAQFAISSSSCLVVLDKSGKVLRKQTMNSQDFITSASAMTTYDFDNGSIIMLNRDQKTFESFRKAKWLWGKRIDFTPNSICLYKNVLCITCNDVILCVDSTTGKPAKLYEVGDLVENCYGMCVVDDVMICSSNSKDIEKSTQLGFVGM